MLFKTYKKDLTLLSGNVLDHFENALYGFLAPILSPIFFPDYDPIVQLILTYSFLGTSIITRPLGALIFGSLANKWGPDICLMFSILGVALATLCIACLPGYESIGWIAPSLLLLFRILKGIFGAGESTIARLSILDSKEKTSAVRASYYYETSGMFGIILASLCANGIIAFQQYDFVWRSCYFLSGILGGVLYIVRHFFMLSPSFDIPKKPFLNFTRLIHFKSLWEEKGNIFRIFCVCSFSYLTYTIPFLLFNSLIPLISSITVEQMMTLNTTFLIVDFLLIPIIGKTIEKFNIHRVMFGSALILILTMIPFFLLLSNASFAFVTFFRFWIVFWGVVFLCPLNLWFKELLHTTPNRFLLVGIGDALAAGITGYISPAICLGLWYLTGNLAMPAVYISIIMLATILSIKKSSLYPTNDFVKKIVDRS